MEGYRSNMTAFNKDLFSELRSIKTIDLAYKATNLLEKILWILIGTIGTGWVVYFVAFQVIYSRLCFGKNILNYNLYEFKTSINLTQMLYL